MPKTINARTIALIIADMKNANGTMTQSDVAGNL